MTSNESPSMRALFKFTLPLMGLFMTFVLLWGDNRRAWIVLPLLLISLYITAADMRMEGQHIYYRFFFSWRKLPGDIADARCTLLPALGYVKFRHFFPPFGLLFFIVERGTGRFIPFRRTTFMQTMLSVSPSRDNESLVNTKSNISEAQETKKTSFSRVLFPVVGILIGMLVPVPWQHWSTSGGQGIISRLVHFQLHPAILGSYAVVLAVLLSRNRSQHFANCGVGFVIGSIVAHLIHLH
jgi:hypothetical protein